MENRLFPKLAQIGLVVRDVDASVRRYRDVLGIEPYRVIERSPTAPGTKWYYGKEADFAQKVALYQLGEIEFELLQPLEGQSVLQDFLDRHGEGVHHIAFDTEDFEGASQRLRSFGAEMIQTGPTSRHPKLRWGFFDTQELLGTTLEIFNNLEIKRLPLEG